MLSRCKNEKTITINVNNIIKVDNSTICPFIEIGIGQASYKMANGGVFKLSEKILYKEIPKINKIEEKINGFKITYNVKKNNSKFSMNIININNKVMIKLNNVDKSLNRLWINIPSDKNEHIYGCGECFTHFDLKGEKVRIWVAEHQNLKRMINKMIGRKILRRKDNYLQPFKKYDSYYVQPTYVSSKKYFVHLDTPYYSEFDFTDENVNKLMVKGIPKEIILGSESNFENLLTNLSSILGRQPKLPEWVYNGTILGIQGGTEVMMDKINKALHNNFKVSGVWCQDWEGIRITKFGRQLMWDWSYDNSLYPNLDKTIKELNEKGIKYLGYINPFLAIEGELYKEASKKGFVVKNNKDEDYMVTITTFPAAMIDLTNPNAFKWIKNIIKKNMIDVGLNGWMADFGEYMPTDAVLYSKVSGEEIHNLWPALWAKANREAIEEAGKVGEVFFFTRAGYTESIKYSTLMWNGDQHVDFSLDDGLPSVIPASLSLAMSGFGLTHSDIGGYTTILDMKRSKDLFMRWAELSAFSPVMRNHEGNRPDDNVQLDYDEEILNIYGRMSRVYNKISPYIKELVDENARKGIPVMRPLFMYYNEEKAYSEKYEYLLGRDLLVSPIIIKNTKSKNVYLPDDKWIHLWTGKEYNGGQYEIESEYGYPPVFYKKDSKYSEIFKDLMYLE